MKHNTMKVVTMGNHSVDCTCGFRSTGHTAMEADNVAKAHEARAPHFDKFREPKGRPYIVGAAIAMATIALIFLVAMLTLKPETEIGTALTCEQVAGVVVCVEQ